MPLNDDEVQQEMKKMVAFIKQEAIEKARELQVKADEEFNIEKAKIVRNETVAIENNYSRKLKQSEVSRKIAQSSMLNKMRLEVLQVRDQRLNELFEEARMGLCSIDKDYESYKALLKTLILEACLDKLLETKVAIKCREQDLELVKSLLPETASAFEAHSGKTVHVSVDGTLPSESFGGVEASCHDGKIKIVNTLEARLSLLCDKMLPEIRVLLLGHSKQRKFFD